MKDRGTFLIVWRSLTSYDSLECYLLNMYICHSHLLFTVGNVISKQSVKKPTVSSITVGVLKMIRARAHLSYEEMLKSLELLVQEKKYYRGHGRGL